MYVKSIKSFYQFVILLKEYLRYVAQHFEAVQLTIWNFFGNEWR